MPSFNTEVPHQLGKDQARERLKGFLENVKRHYKDQVSEFTEEWSDDVLKFAMTTYGLKIEGVLTVTEESVLVDGSLPFVAMPYKGKIQQSITDELKKALA